MISFCHGGGFMSSGVVMRDNQKVHELHIPVPTAEDLARLETEARVKYVEDVKRMRKIYRFLCPLKP